MTKSRTGWAGLAAVMGEVKNAYMILGERPERKRTLGRSGGR
jgi:hypothetical protein